MSAEETFRLSEQNALSGEDHFSSVTGKNLSLSGEKNGSGKSRFGATGAIIGFIGIALFLFLGNDNLPSDLNDRLISQTDVQYADAVESRNLAISEALKSGDFPSDTTEKLKSDGYDIGYIDEYNNFIETNKAPYALAIRKDDKIIPADQFLSTVKSDVKLYNAINKATYDRAAGYYDEAADKVFKEIGVSRNNFTTDASFEEVLSHNLGYNTNVEINTASKVTTDENTYYETPSATTSTRYSNAETLINDVVAKNPGASTTEATLAAADTLKVADTINKEQRSSIFYVTVMETISKMKVGEGATSHINEALNYLHKSTTTRTVDTDTGEIIETTGSALESPSLRAILSDGKVDTNLIKNYSSDRILDLTANKLNLTTAATHPVSSLISTVISKTVSSVYSRARSTVGRIFSIGKESGDANVLKSSAQIISSSILENNVPTGVDAGEFLVEGAVNVGRKLAVSGSGATAGDADAVIAYQKNVKEILALDAEADRLNRSPFDITSKNTFLGSLVRQLATVLQPSSFSRLTSISNLASKSIASIISPNTYADSTNTYLSNFGNCSSYATIGAVGTGHGSWIATFDTSTLDAFNSAEFNKFVEENTVLKDGVRTIKQKSVLADFILYNDERKTPLATIDGGILDALKKKSSSIPFISDIASMIESLSEASDKNLRIASGAAFVNSKDNADWQTYKYAQRYVSIARATANLRRFSNDPTAYQNIQYFEGSENPVVAFLESQNSIANLP